MVSAATVRRAHGNGFVSMELVARQEDDGQPILLSAMWLVPGALVGVVMVLLMLMSGKK
jgi:hypothetical protein